jgi:hypothetical protein
MCKPSKVSIVSTTAVTKDPNNSRENTFALVGDVIHIVHLINITIFAWCVVNYSNKSTDSSSSSSEGSIFDPVWEKDGFCISNPTT